MLFHKNRIPAHDYNEVQESNKSKGQSLVEFALVSVILFAFLMGIMDAGRLLLTYSAVSNAAQEGSRYAVLRPRDVLGVTEATQIARTPRALLLPCGTPTCQHRWCRTGLAALSARPESTHLV